LCHHRKFFLCETSLRKTDEPSDAVRSFIFFHVWIAGNALICMAVARRSTKPTQGASKVVLRPCNEVQGSGAPGKQKNVGGPHN
jgi:hypothetical protein